MKKSKQWPKQSEEGTIRIYGQNLNGISQRKKYSEWDYILDKIHNKQVEPINTTQ